MFRSERAGLLRPKRLFLGLGWLLLGLAPLFFLSAFFTHGATIMTGFYAVLFGLMSFSYGSRSIKGAKADDGTLEIGEKAITFRGNELVKREELKQAFVVPQQGAPLVRLERKGRMQPPLFVRLGDQGEAAAFMRALGFDAEHSAAEMRVASSMLGWGLGKQMLAILGPMLVFMAAIFGLTAVVKSPPALLALTLAFVAYVFSLAFAPTTVRVGTDGVFTRWLGRKRFIAHSEIDVVTTYDEVRGTKRQRGVRVTLKSGEVIRLPTGQRDIALTEAAQLERRIDEAREADERGAAGGTTDVLARGDRTVADWIRYLRGVGAGAVNLRAPAIPPDVLLRVVEDSKAAPLERASAAVAAIASGGDDVKERVRVAADTTVSPKLRIALERIASGAEENDEELLETLDELNELNERRGAS
jgi:hypothetical protein